MWHKNLFKIVLIFKQDWSFNTKHTLNIFGKKKKRKHDNLKRWEEKKNYLLEKFSILENMLSGFLGMIKYTIMMQTK